MLRLSWEVIAVNAHVLSMLLGLTLATSVLAAKPRPPVGSELDPEGPRAIQVTGEGEVQVEPDEATLVLSVVTRAEQAERAVQENARRMKEVVAKLEAAGLSPEALETGQYSLHPDYHHPREGPPEQRGFRATNTLKVTVKVLERLGTLIDRAVKAGANEVQSVQFSLADPKAAQERALADAVARARSSARVMANALGVRLGPVLQASTTSSPPPVMPLEMRARTEEAATTPIRPEAQTVRATVTLVFAIAR